MGRIDWKPLQNYSIDEESWPWLYNDGCREDQPRHFGTDPSHLIVTYAPSHLELTMGYDPYPFRCYAHVNGECGYRDVTPWKYGIFQPRKGYVQNIDDYPEWVRWSE